MYIHTYIHTFIRMYIYLHTYVHIHSYIHTCILTSTWISVWSECILCGRWGQAILRGECGKLEYQEERNGCSQGFSHVDQVSQNPKP
jgi:hypothetical protein